MARLMVSIDNPAQLRDEERRALLENCRLYNLSFYRLRRRIRADARDPAADKKMLLQLSSQLGLDRPIDNPCADENHISHIEVSSRGEPYIPYTNKALGWHTDGYYNGAERTVRSFAMHCVRPAAHGGENLYFDPAVLFALLMDEDADYVSALRHPETFRIPANVQTGNERASSVHAVFNYDAERVLFMRYTQRARNVQWRNETMTQKALAFIREVLDTPSRFRLRYKLQAGEGVIANNVLHNRAAFKDGLTGKRLLYRARWRTRPSPAEAG